jgi:hypothetical protein
LSFRISTIEEYDGMSLGRRAFCMRLKDFSPLNPELSKRQL